MRTIWIVLCGLSGVAGIASAFLRHFDLNQVLVTEQGFEGMGGTRRTGVEGGDGKEGEDGVGTEVVEKRD